MSQNASHSYGRDLLTMPPAQAVHREGTIRRQTTTVRGQPQCVASTCIWQHIPVMHLKLQNIQVIPYRQDEHALPLMHGPRCYFSAELLHGALTMPPMPEGLPCPCCCMLHHKRPFSIAHMLLTSNHLTCLQLSSKEAGMAQLLKGLKSLLPQIAIRRK